MFAKLTQERETEILIAAFAHEDIQAAAAFAEACYLSQSSSQVF